MNLFKRVTASVRANLDEAISQIENHDAVIETAIREERDAIARLKLQQSRIRREQERLNGEINQASQDEANWTERAKRCAQNADEQQALRCLERRSQCRADIQRLRAKAETTGKQLLDTESRLSEAQGRVDAMEQRRRDFQNRDLSARADQAWALSSGNDADGIEQAFDRWELQITRGEMNAQVANSGTELDPLEAQFKDEEKQSALKAELKALMEGE